jgi:two-component system OmpR family sensor kinase
MSSRSRLVAAVLVLTLLTLGGAFFAVYLSFNRSQERQLDDALLSAARTEARMLSEQPSAAIALSNLPGPAANQVGPLAPFAAVLDGSRRVAQSTTMEGRLLAPRVRAFDAPFDVAVRDGALRAVWVAVPGERRLELFFAVPRSDLDGDATLLLRAMVVAFLVAVLWTTLLATGIVRVFTSEQRRIAEVARMVADGDLSARIGSRTNDREIARFAQDIDAMIERLALLVTSQQRFIAYAAHELRSPLTMLYGELSHALRRSRSAEEYKSSIEEALEATRRLKQLSEDLLELARISAVSTTPSERVSLEDSLASVLSDTAPLAQSRKVSLRSNAQRCECDGHPRDLERMLRNLVENAIRHGPEGTDVTISIERRGTLIELSVEDEGPGVRDDEREKIFEPFYRSSSEGSDGTGLGLAIARDIARAHGGDVFVDPAPRARGARFVATVRGA